jgi:acyl-CoA synthetase (AMP-forming)/AMP-acid ligase II
MVNGLFFAFVHGASLVLQEMFVPEETLNLLSRHRCTLYAGVPSMCTDLLAPPHLSDTDLSALQALKCALHGVIALRLTHPDQAWIAWERLVTHLVTGVVRE